MKILVDADACPNVIKEILFRAAERTKTLVILVANQRLNIPPSEYIKMKKVAAGFDVADHEIVQQAEAGDLVITADIPLADLVVKKDCLALNPRGELYTEENIRQRLAMRNLMEQLRDSGVTTGGPNSLSKQHRQAFANQLDRFITQQRSS
ncbi:MAG: YaiI/YqxD family protein [Coxiellaceae bacterium]|nr:YaiI/YqxD family protein [Coxiellaceae bacterium]